MTANYGYSDGSGTYYVTVDTDLCNGCGDCARACPAGILEVVPNPFDPLADQDIVVVKSEFGKRLKYTCAPCKPAGGWTTLPCVAACPTSAVTHSW